MSNFDLSKFEKAFNAANQATAGDGNSRTGDEPPDGEYEATIEKAEVRLTAKNDPKLFWQFRIDGPDQKGRCLFRHDVFSTDEKKMGFLMKDIRTCGVSLASFAEIESKAGNLVGKRVAIRKRTSGDFVNVYVNGLLGDAIPF